MLCSLTLGLSILLKKLIGYTVLKGLKITPDQLEDREEEKKENKIKVKYPLFVKKSKENLFQRAGKDDFKGMKKQKQKDTRVLKRRNKRKNSPAKQETSNRKHGCGFKSHRSNLEDLPDYDPCTS
jgi:hypothetical protein